MTIIKPNFYKQIASPWAYHSRNGCTVAGYACGEFSVFNIVSRTTKHWTNPLQVWNWAWNHGMILKGAGTYWSGIGAMLNAAGIKTWKTTTNWDEVHHALRQNKWCIGIMHPGIWTRGGHFIVAYYVDKNDNIYISDSASYAGYRQFNRWSNFKAQCNNVWVVVDPRDYIKGSVGKSTGDHTAVLYTDNNEANVRKSASGNSALVTTLKKNEKLKLDNYSAGWWKIVKGKGKGGWIHESNLSKYKQVSYTYKLKYAMNVRDGYSTQAKVLETIKAGTVLKCKKQRGNWAYFKKQKGLANSGWIKIRESSGKEYLNKVKK